MTSCVNCEETFDVSDARSKYDALLGAGAYDEDFDVRGWCGRCAVGQAEDHMSIGRAIDMVNGEEAYDDDFVQEWL